MRSLLTKVSLLKLKKHQSIRHPRMGCQGPSLENSKKQDIPKRRNHKLMDQSSHPLHCPREFRKRASCWEIKQLKQVDSSLIRNSSLLLICDSRTKLRKQVKICIHQMENMTVTLSKMLMIKI